MSRRTNKIILQRDKRDGLTNYVQVVDTVWHLTYDGQLARLRQEHHWAGGSWGFKYPKCSWTTEATGWTAVSKLAKLYNDQNFGLMEIKGRPIQ